MGFNNIPEMFFSQAKKLDTQVAEQVKRGGRWVNISWREMEISVREIAYGLLSFGLKRGDAVAIFSGTRAEWIHSDLGIQSAGGISIPIYSTLTTDQAEYILNDSDSKFIFVENAVQLEKILSIRKGIPGLKFIIMMEGAADGKEGILTLEEIQRQGREDAKKFEKTVEDIVGGLKRSDVATIVYTSGTTGPPKGVVQTHGNHIAICEGLSEVTYNQPDDINLLFLPLAHSFARVEEFFDIYLGLTTAYAESIEKVVDNMAEVRPHFMCSVPRVFEKAYAAVLANVQAGSPLKRKIFNWSIGVGRQVSRLIQAKKPIPPGLRVKKAIAEALVFNKLHRRFGGRLRFFISGGAPLSKDIAEFFHSAGILILEGYGLTETCPATHVNRPDNYKFGTVGLPIPGVEVKLAPDGEVLVRGGNIAVRGYHKRDEDTREVFSPDGWFRTGDIGEIDSEGFLRITDRKKDLIKTSGGKFIAPQNIENMLKTDPFVSQAVVIGDRRPYCVALISITQAEAEKFAREKGISFTNYEGLTRKPAVFDRVKHAVDTINARLASFETIKKFAIVPRDFSQEYDEVTPTLKIKRKVITERYKATIESLYRA